MAHGSWLLRCVVELSSCCRSAAGDITTSGSLHREGCLRAATNHDNVLVPQDREAYTPWKGRWQVIRCYAFLSACSAINQGLCLPARVRLLNSPVTSPGASSRIRHDTKFSTYTGIKQEKNSRFYCNRA
ncbi:hypothetical protein BO70DRAFT_103974 [Aspergillus heteromorphus CBS 117.55]|uniref:Secreted protein n=1 Tax=Aspergillus heteromorphus CBS 117.55 TaxID=1448321 RepID=A0A317VMG9_9EURO|nr:uncharacterized protein BO70DRAFT_103974 [Aspergillus heteromorphus CBS 117.55]PWY74287.1 hypothetical protein BO70DRAFT_103974 [Aspergillus heteromorphus CBS 117.55]